MENEDQEYDIEFKAFYNAGQATVAYLLGVRWWGLSLPDDRLMGCRLMHEDKYGNPGFESKSLPMVEVPDIGMGKYEPQEEHFFFSDSELRIDIENHIAVTIAGLLSVERVLGRDIANEIDTLDDFNWANMELNIMNLDEQSHALYFELIKNQTIRLLEIPAVQTAVKATALKLENEKALGGAAFDALVEPILEGLHPYFPLPYELSVNAVGQPKWENNLKQYRLNEMIRRLQVRADRTDPKRELTPRDQ